MEGQGGKPHFDSGPAASGEPEAVVGRGLKLASRQFTLAVAMISLVACVFLSLLAWKLARDYDLEASRGEFSRRADQVRQALSHRLDDYEQVLRSGVGLLEGSEQVSRSEWRAFAQALRPGQIYPGIQGLGFARRLQPSELDAFLRRQEPIGAAPYRLFPVGDRPQYSAIEFLEPMDSRNRRAIGYDMLSEPVRREAMLRARDTGTAALSGKVRLLQETDQDVQPGSLLYLPAYRQGLPTATVEQRREALLGWVYCPLRMRDFTLGAVQPLLKDLRLRLYDGELASPAQQLFDSLRKDEVADIGHLSRSTLQFAGHRWSLELMALNSFAATQRNWAPLVLVMGLTVSVLICLVVLTLLRSESRARRLAAKMGKAFRESEGRHLAIVQATTEAIITLDEQAKVQTFSTGAERIFGYRAAEVIGHDLALLIPDRHRSETKEQLRRFFRSGDASVVTSRQEAVGRRKGGAEFPATLSLGRMKVGAGNHAVALIQDLTEQRKAESALLEADHLQKLLFSSVPYPIIATALDGSIQYLNQAAELALGYRPEELVRVRSALGFYVREEIADRASSSALRDQVRSDAVAFGVLVEGCVSGQPKESEWTYIRKDGSSFPALVTASTITDRAGARVGYIFLVVDISDRKQVELRIRHLAHHDALTNLPNRALLNERLAVAIQRAADDGSQVGVLMLDLDHFKRINDTLGHQIGDGLLVEISNRLKAMVRREDTVARMGGDEFVIVLAGVPDADRVGAIAEKIVEGVFRPVTVNGHELQVSGSVGGCLYPRDGSDEGTLLRNADAAMYSAKQRGRANFQWFSRSMMKVAEEKMALEVELRRAIDKGQLRLGYQPLVCLRTGKLLGLEALLRWRHPERGLISPTVFIPLAEEAGLILRLGDWVLTEACHFCHELSRKLGYFCPVAVNISPRQLSQPDFVNRVAEICRQEALPAGALTFEITESIMVDRPEEALKILTALRSMGVQIAIDDFGTGYSSLSYITHFPVDKLKIDRSFIRDIGKDPADDAITNAIIAMARSLNLDVVAEGVENPEQLRYLIDQRCHSAQGYLFGEMAAVDEVVAFHKTSRIAMMSVPVNDPVIAITA